MKQKYEKPAFLAESFSLCQTVAAGCGVNAIPYALHSHASVCAWETRQDFWNVAEGSYTSPGDGKWDTIFTGGHCNIIVTTDAESMVYDACYNNPDGSMKAFSS